MSAHFIHALAQRHAEIERKIEQAMRSPAPDSLYISSLKKLRLAYRDQIQQVIREKRTRAAERRKSRLMPPPPVTGDSARLSQGF